MSFIETLSSKLMELKGVSKSTADAYMKSLFSLNNKKEFKNAAWLKKTDVILAKIASDYAMSTQRTLLATLVSVTSILGPSYKKTNQIYSTAMNAAVDEHRSEPAHEMTKKQEENWLTWDVVQSKLDSLIKESVLFSKKKIISEAEWNTLLSLMVLSLYVYLPPRRNADYQLMFLNNFRDTPEDVTKNWYNIKTNQFVFNVYKTAKTFGQQIELVPEQLGRVLTFYLKFHPTWRSKEAKKTLTVPLLVSSNGTHLTASNAITRILNKIFEKNVGSSMLRHIYLSSKYGDEEIAREKDAMSMAHSVSQQKDYILCDKDFI